MIGSVRLCRSGFPILVLSLLVLVTPLALFAQEDRAEMIGNSSGQTLRMRDLGACDGCDPDDQGIDLRIFPLSGGSTLVATDGQTVSTSEGNMLLVGFGASPDMNDSGQVTFMSGLHDADWPYYNCSWCLTYEADIALGLFQWSAGTLTQLRTINTK